MSQQGGVTENPTHYDCLLIDDDELLSAATREYFAVYGISVFWAQNAKTGLSFLAEHTVDLILLDINLEETTGFEVCKSLREITDVPILFISARQSDDDRLLALTIGGDDYIQKPYSLSVLHAKVKVVLSRYRNSLDHRVKTLVLKTGELILNEGDYDTRLKGQRIELRPMEFKILKYLMKNA
jgi:two-component system response regulator RegX3